jgi:hypothetical protein
VTAEPEMVDGPWVRRLRFGPTGVELISTLSQ